MFSNVRSLSIFLIVLLVAAVSAIPAVDGSHAQTMRGEEFPRIDAAIRAAIVDSITDAIDSIYVIEAGAKQIVTGLRANLASGAYDEYDDPSTFADRLYEDAQAIHHDGHFRIGILPPLTAAAMEADDGADPLPVDHGCGHRPGLARQGPADRRM